MGEEEGRSRKRLPLFCYGNGLQCVAFTPTFPLMFKRIALALAALLMSLAASTPALAQSMEGTWDFRIDGTTIFRFEIEKSPEGEWLGEWQRPEQFNTDGDNFANMAGGVKSSDSMTGIEFLGQVELSFDDPRPGAVPDIFRFDLTGDDSATMHYVGTELAPYSLVRAAEEDVIGDWDAPRIYRRNPPRLLIEDEDEEEEEAGLSLEPLTIRRGPVINFLDLTPSDAASASAGEEPAGAAAEQPAADAEDAVAEAAEAAPETEEPVEAEGSSLLGDDFLDGL